MTTKKQYSIGDSAWIYGITADNKLTQGQVIHKFILDGHDEVFYIVAVPTSIEDLLEVRTWATISQDAQGPVGGFREGMENINSTKRYLSKAGVKLDILDFVDTALLNTEIENKTNSLSLSNSSKHNNSNNRRSKRRPFKKKHKQ